MSEEWKGVEVCLCGPGPEEAIAAIEKAIDECLGRRTMSGVDEKYLNDVETASKNALAIHGPTGSDDFRQTLERHIELVRLARLGLTAKKSMGGAGALDRLNYLCELGEWGERHGIECVKSAKGAFEESWAIDWNMFDDALAALPRRRDGV